MDIYFSIGIIGRPYSDFDLVRLTLKPNIENNIIIPEEFLVTLPSEMYVCLTNLFQINNHHSRDTTIHRQRKIK
jgi:hypothetical protein